VGAGFRVESKVAAGFCAESFAVAVVSATIETREMREMRHFARVHPSIRVRGRTMIGSMKFSPRKIDAPGAADCPVRVALADN
jgi:hypothetical protein